MKAFNYKKGKAIIRTLKEPKIKKKKFNFDRVLYLLIILGLFIWLSSFIYKKTVWLEGNGQMLMDKVDVNFTNDIRLKQLFINEGDTVTVGTKLFNYFQNNFDSDASLVLKNLDKKEQTSNNLATILKQIHLNSIRLKGLQKKLAYLKIQEKKVTKLVLLDVYTKTKLDGVISLKLQVENDINVLKNELYFLSLQKKMLQPSSNLLLNNSNNYQNTYISPIKGVVGQILKNSEESCYKAENVMTIHNVEKVFIKAYFDLKDLANIKKGDLVQVEFPDKTTSEGIINKLYISTYKAPTEFQKKYEPTERNILTEIVPLDTTQTKEWAKFYKLNLKIKIGKF
ncbi:multidrug resistance efflux pump [Lutibacter sp. Hel_I_33_5]|uniref:hypothetical protein n=1 Tax=Lutibacter sp. Hel_I_33_5 TaxID=1566289 RepID=UPI0011A19091|nr:hypothetical protein [Lutibacter sp. Hel_I_33_5]TVZ56423.1 multidrug resistance efflux pump [Lutibacter sp. Hel_I_33_5]